MRFVQRAAVTGLFAIWLAPLPSLAGSESSNSSSNCSNGRCTRVESMVIEDRYGRRGWVREERWREGDRRRGRVEIWPGIPYRLWQPPRRERDDDDD